MYLQILFGLFTVLNSNSYFVDCFHVHIKDNSPMVQGGTVRFTAEVFEDDGRPASGNFRYTWKDNGIPMHSIQHESTNTTDVVYVQYKKELYPPGTYLMQIEVCRIVIYLCISTFSNRTYFDITENLNGEIALIQRNQTLRNTFVSNDSPVRHNVLLSEDDANFIKKAPTINTYWFVDCTYYGFTGDFSFPFNYTKPDKDHLVEALVVADFTPLPPPPTTTTTTTTPKPTTTKPTTTTTTKPTTTTTTKKATTKKPDISATTLAPKKIKRSIDALNSNGTSKITVLVNGTLVPYNGSFPFICNNGTTVVTDFNKTYGYFAKRVIVKSPVSAVNITGNNWLRHGELLTLNVKCEGSRNLKYCVYFKVGEYNVTGNETCYNPHELEYCEFSVQRYFSNAVEHTIILIIENEVSKVVKPVAVKIYEVKKQAQLSVIVVPVAFSIVAVVLIVFGVAYYLQNRSRFVVEVANFDFGQNYSDMEYKTFWERLRDSIVNAFFSRGPTPGSSEVPVWPPGRKYGSMTS